MASFVDLDTTTFFLLLLHSPTPTPPQPNPNPNSNYSSISSTKPFLFSSSSSLPSPPTQAQLFVDFVNRSLFFRTFCGLHKFSVEFGLTDYAAMSNKEMTRWLQFAIRAKVRELVFDSNNAAATGKKDNNELIKTAHHYEVPQQVYYQGHSVAVLRLSLCYINPNHCVVNWKSLKFLSLRLAKMSEDAIQQIISGESCT